MLYHTTTGFCTQGRLCRGDVADCSNACHFSLHLSCCVRDYRSIVVLPYCAHHECLLSIFILPGVETTGQHGDVNAHALLYSVASIRIH